MRALILPFLILSACSNVVPSTAMRLNALSPLEADPAQFAVAITLPEGLDIEPKSARLRFNVRRSDTGETRNGNFVLQRVVAGPAIYQVAPDDLDALRAVQAVARQWKGENPGATRGSMSVTLSPCKAGEGPADNARASIAIKVTADGPYLPLIRNGPISAVSDPEQIRKMGACTLDLQR